MLTKNIDFKNFNFKKNKKNFLSIKYLLNKILKEKNEILNSSKKEYKNFYNKRLISKFKNKSIIFLIGIGGSVLGAKAIYNFLKKRIYKKFFFIDNFENIGLIKKTNNKTLNLIISKSGNTLETIANSNVLIKKKQPNIFITENKKSYLMDLANELKADVIHHNNFIGGRFSVLSEVGMLPAELMGLNSKKFKVYNDIVKSKKFLDSLIHNVSSILNLVKKKKLNSVILNYDENSNDLFNWYQQLVAESLGKKNKGILPIISSMPKDNHSVMQLYLDGTKGNFYTFFFAQDNASDAINHGKLLKSHFYLKKKNLQDIKRAQFMATEKVFNTKNIPYRSFFIKKRNEKTLGELFVFFMLETILLGKALNVNPYDQPAVELIKVETKKFLLKS